MISPVKIRLLYEQIQLLKRDYRISSNYIFAEKRNNKNDEDNWKIHKNNRYMAFVYER